MGAHTFNPPREGPVRETTIVKLIFDNREHRTNTESKNLLRDSNDCRKDIGQKGKKGVSTDLKEMFGGVDVY